MSRLKIGRSFGSRGREAWPLSLSSLEATVKAARAGNSSLAKSIVVPDVAPLKILLAKRADREATKKTSKKRVRKEKDLDGDEGNDEDKPATKKPRATTK